MSKVSLALDLAKRFNDVSFSKASKFIDDVGVTRAEDALQSAQRTGDDALSSNWWKAGAATGVVGGGALAWRQQDLEEARAIAQQQQSASNSLASIMNSDLSPEAKRKLTSQLLEQMANQNNGGNGDNGGGGNPLADLLPDGMGGLQATLGLVIVLAILVQFGGNN
jgi:hypothetical protein